jgi:muramoyltetrapeptide carboxypeptidase
MAVIFPEKLKRGDHVRVIAPSRSYSIIGDEVRAIAFDRFAQLGLKVSFGAHVEECDDYCSSSVQSRVHDIHDAFLDNRVKAIFTAIGGYNSNQLLRYLDWKIIKNNPKILCGFSDITALQNAIFAKTSLVTYSGPHYSTCGQKHCVDYTLTHLTQCLFDDQPFVIKPAESWFDDEWWMDQEKRVARKSDGWVAIHKGCAQGKAVGGNLSTLSLLFGTEYFPCLDGAIVFIEDDGESHYYDFDRRVQSLIHQPGFDGVKGLVIGRFQRSSNMTIDRLRFCIETKKELAHIPIIADVECGHTDPKCTWPIGGDVELCVNNPASSIAIVTH